MREAVATVRGPEGKPLYTQTLLIDIGERKRADEERERLLAAEREATARTVERQRRLDFVREAGQVLASSTDYRSAIQRVAELASGTTPTGASSTSSRTGARSSESPSRGRSA